MPPQINTSASVTSMDGEPFSLPLTTVPYPSPYWFAEGLPQGLDVEGVAGDAAWRIVGTPTTPGIFYVRLTALNPQFNGPVTATLIMTVIDSAGPPIITAQPGDQSVAVGDTATFAVVVSGAAPLRYQWRRNETLLPDAMAAWLTVRPVQNADLGSYTVVVSNPFGSVTSHEARLVIPSNGTFQIGSIASVSDGWALTWASEADATYQLLASPAISGPWEKLEPVKTSRDNGTTTVVVAGAPGEARFFRVIASRLTRTSP